MPATAPVELSVELISTGSELLSGRTVNTHARTLAEKLQPLGLQLVRDTTVPDDVEQIREAVFAALCRVDIVFVSGGLGATSDDVTRAALGRLLDRQLIVHPPSLDAMIRRYAAMGRAVTAVAARQALILAGSEGLLNPVGIAPGMMIELPAPVGGTSQSRENEPQPPPEARGKDAPPTARRSRAPQPPDLPPSPAKLLFVLPGPPREFSGVLETHVLPLLGKRLGAAASRLEKVFMVCGLGESEVAERLEAAGLPAPGIEVGYCARPGETEVRLLAAAAQAPLLAATAAAARQALGDTVFAEARIGMEEAVGQLLAARQQTLAVAESCTGGLIGHRLTQVAGSSAYFLGGVIAYANASKIRDLGVPETLLAQHGAVSEETALAMAEGVRARFGADFGLAVTGVAGPAGGTAEKPVGTVWLAVADAAGVVTQPRCFPGARDAIKLWSSQLALDLLRRRLQGLPPAGRT
ncbi:MAG: nicotinamide-nucleotide amidohydrolase family protein [Kiritimatiellaeota bacterium]|nr:nicotinamide-nucleotide amidohydrolase family protein [Kiritimatiellota bacterium]